MVSGVVVVVVKAVVAKVVKVVVVVTTFILDERSLDVFLFFFVYSCFFCVELDDYEIWTWTYILI